jgi:hypothetical protein
MPCLQCVTGVVSIEWLAPVPHLVAPVASVLGAFYGAAIGPFARRLHRDSYNPHGTQLQSLPISTKRQWSHVITRWSCGGIMVKRMLCDSRDVIMHARHACRRQACMYWRLRELQRQCNKCQCVDPSDSIKRGGAWRALLRRGTSRRQRCRRSNCFGRVK